MPALEERTINGSSSSPDDITLHIDTMLNVLPSSSSTNPSIYRIDDQLRSLDPEAYDPQLVAIGPFHRDKKHLQKMEFFKKHYLKQVLARRNEASVGRYVAELKGLEERARSCYAEQIEIESDQFVQMLLLDGIFIVEFLRKYDRRGLMFSRWATPTDDDDDAILRFGHVRNHLFRDFLLCENQLPLFVIKKLFDMSNSREGAGISHIMRYLVGMPSGGSGALQDFPQHLIGWAHLNNCSPFQREFEEAYPVENVIPATEMKEHGIIFEKAEEGDYLFDIRFRNKTLTMPSLTVYDETESQLKNFIAYEHYLPEDEMKFYTDYAFFLHCLIHSARDAKLLHECGIINNWLGGDEMVYHMITRLGKNVQISKRFSYNNVFKAINKHCGNKRNAWMAMLRRDYFNGPWKLISLLGVSAILLLTLTQTTFAILSYKHEMKKGS